MVPWQPLGLFMIFPFCFPTKRLWLNNPFHIAKVIHRRFRQATAETEQLRSRAESAEASAVQAQAGNL